MLSSLPRQRVFQALQSLKNYKPPLIQFQQRQTFTTTPPLPEKPLPPRLKFDDADLMISYLKGTGPGGQKINKTNSAVQITHKPSGVVVKCQATRSRSQNAKMARALLADRVEEREKGDQSRVALKAAAARKKKASTLKKTRRKYRNLEKDGVEHAPGEMGAEEEGAHFQGEESPANQLDSSSRGDVDNKRDSSS
ncbi:peptide chain release factor-like protein [Penicillium angulare]|uniref:Peptide chain release factor-like protein n=1 Tax=Penicillium angulare TaxID=116970 RepID=A0A9W9FWJ1_9EURO|nr:peptide chain release factor-like protein [Penicillium angulare]